MSRGAQFHISKTKNLPKPSAYVLAMYNEYQGWAFDEEETPKIKGRWAEEFGSTNPIDLEIGTGNGTHFAHRAVNFPDRNLVGLELKYKPLIQTIRRARRQGCVNAKVARFNASLLSELFVPNELNDVYIYFPDPWEKLSQQKHRLIQSQFLDSLHDLQKEGSHVEFKTDSQSYFAWALTIFQKSRYQILAHTEDLYSSPWAENNYPTAFEAIFARQGLKISYLRAQKAETRRHQ